ncbi:MAG: large conductance mechanosensitive channel protein MscL [Nitratireductor sp.]|nr:large conductance mechanosensitive channel protein MscL [Nitratireductor sp.]
MVDEFRAFIMRGNVMDLAVGVIIGGAFGTIVASLTQDVIMPIVGAFGSVNFNDYFIPLSSSVTAPTLAAAREQGPVLAFGAFVTALINFLILAFIVFLMVKLVNRVLAAPQPKPAEPPAPTSEERLLAEIRDLLAAQAGPAVLAPPKGR